VNLKKIIALFAAGGATKRFHTQETTRENTVGHHSYGVAWFCYVLTKGKPSAAMLMHALAHDVTECVVGDVPAPTKKLRGIGEQMAVLEEHVLRWGGVVLPELNPCEERLVKLADYLDGLLFTIMELRRGNAALAGCHANYLAYISEFVEYGDEHEQLVFEIVAKLRTDDHVWPGQSGHWYQRFQEWREEVHV
jgi:5'-deoxynucleotidase YfbR-like HD superfamily hydrolase